MLTQVVIQGNNLGFGVGESIKPNPSKVSLVPLGGLVGEGVGGCCKLPQELL